MISAFTPIRNWYAVGPVVVQSPGAVGAVKYHSVDDLVDPVGQPHREAGGDDIPAAALHLVGVRIEDDGEQRDATQHPSAAKRRDPRRGSLGMWSE